MDRLIALLVSLIPVVVIASPFLIAAFVIYKGYKSKAEPIDNNRKGKE